VSDWYDPDIFPELRDGPPWVMEEMIASQPELLEGIATGADTAAVALTVRAGRPLEVVGCGTSEHAAMGIAAILSEAGQEAHPRQALEAAVAPSGGGAMLAVSHEAGTWATGQAMIAARAAGARVGLVTATPAGELAGHADAVLATPAKDRSWCHTIGYTSPLAAGLALTAAVGGPPVPAGAVSELVSAGIRARPQAAAAAAALAESSRLVVVACGADRVSGRELALKIEEATHLPTVMRDLETFLHGHLPAEGETTGLVLIACDRRSGDVIAHRARTLLRAAAAVGIRCAAIGTGGFDGLAAAGEITAASAPGLPAAAAALLGAAAPLQLLTLELALARGTNPDLIRREQAPYRTAAAIIEGS
jgi:glucosamine--fructose-6-phosphate aminotransferase (isomerizing)